MEAHRCDLVAARRDRLLVAPPGLQHEQHKRRCRCNARQLGARAGCRPGQAPEQCGGGSRQLPGPHSRLPSSETENESRRWFSGGDWGSWLGYCRRGAAPAWYRPATHPSAHPRVLPGAWSGMGEAAGACSKGLHQPPVMWRTSIMPWSIVATAAWQCAPPRSAAASGQGLSPPAGAGIQWAPASRHTNVRKHGVCSPNTTTWCSSYGPSSAPHRAPGRQGRAGVAILPYHRNAHLLRP